MITANEIREIAERLSRESQDSTCWRMDPIVAYYHDGVMGGFGGGETAEWGDGTIANEMIVPTAEEREAFDLTEDDVVVLTYHSEGGAPDADVVTRKEWEEHKAAFDAETESEV